MPNDVDTQALARGVLTSLTDSVLVLAVPGTEYRLQLVPTVPAGEISTPVGKRVKGTIRATALRMHAAQAGGRFIEPVWGAPRIVAGRAVAVDAENKRVLVDASVPMWVSPPDGQDFSVIREGGLVNFHVESGATFTPVERD
ncbi:MAG: hypothetical protein ACYS0G_04450 [Planctomycetota bacterium]